MHSFFYDLHLHSCLSPCGDEMMTPASIAGISALNGLDFAALTDHNSCRNCPAFLKACEAYGMIGIPGMELTTSEDFHCVLLFEQLEDALSFDVYTEQHRMHIPNKAEIYGHQYIMDEHDRILGEEKDLLIPATSISFEDLSDLADAFHAVMFPAHIDKSSSSLLSSLGSIPPTSRFHTAEFHDLHLFHAIKNSNPYLDCCHIISNSDAHRLEDIRDTAAGTALSLPLPERSRHALLHYLNHPADL